MSSTSSKVLACLITISHLLSSFSIPYPSHSLVHLALAKVQAHVGIEGNERADANASKGTHQLAPIGRHASTPPLPLLSQAPNIPLSFSQAPISQQSDHLARVLTTAATHSLPRKTMSVRKPYLSSTTRQLISGITSDQHSPDQIHLRKVIKKSAKQANAGFWIK